MRPSSRHPQVQQYFAELRVAASDLSEEARSELLGEAVRQLNAATRGVPDEQIPAALAPFATPEEVVAASLRQQHLTETENVPKGAVALYVAVVGLVFVFVPWVGVAFGVGAIVLAVSAFLQRRSAGLSVGMPLSAAAVGVVAIVLPLVLLAVLKGVQEDQSNPDPKVLETGN